MSMMMMGKNNRQNLCSSFVSVFLFLLLGRRVSALDVEVVDYECDSSLYVTADFNVKCDGNSRCSFGESTATVAGQLYYAGVDKTGIEDNVGYLTTDIELMTLKYNFHEWLPVPLCEYVSGSDSNQYDCPGDGTYEFSVSYKLPSAGGESTSWLASGWAGQGVISMYAEQDDSMLIGQCTFYMKTYVTPDAERGIFQSPSAAATVGIVLGVAAALVLVCVYMRCCRGDGRRDRRKMKQASDSSKDDALSQLSRDDITTLFKKLDEESKSHVSGSPSRATGAQLSRASMQRNSVSLSRSGQVAPQQYSRTSTTQPAGASQSRSAPYSPPTQQQTAPNAVEKSVDRPVSPLTTASAAIPQGDADDTAANDATAEGGSNNKAKPSPKKKTFVLTLFNRTKKNRQKASDMAL